MFCGSLLVAFALNRHWTEQKKRDNARNVILQLIEIEHDAGEVCQTSMAYGRSTIRLSVCLSDFNNFKVVWPQSAPAAAAAPPTTEACVNDLGSPFCSPSPSCTPPLGAATDPTAIQIVRPWGSHT